MSTTVWQVGDVKIAPILELQATRTPDFGYRNLSTKEILEQTWLKPHFAADDGQLKSCIQAFVVETPELTIIVDTCVGNEKDRGNPA